MNYLEDPNIRNYRVFPAIFIAKFEEVAQPAQLSGEILYDKNRWSSLVLWCEKEGFKPLNSEMDTKALGLNGLCLPQKSIPKAKNFKKTDEERCFNEEWRPPIKFRYYKIKKIVKKNL